MESANIVDIKCPSLRPKSKWPRGAIGLVGWIQNPSIAPAPHRLLGCGEWLISIDSKKRVIFFISPFYCKIWPSVLMTKGKSTTLPEFALADHTSVRDNAAKIPDITFQKQFKQFADEVLPLLGST